MEHWLNGAGKDCYPPTWEGLYTLLEDAQCSQVAEELKKAVEEKMAGDRASEAAVVLSDSSVAIDTAKGDMDTPAGE